MICANVISVTIKKNQTSELEIHTFVLTRQIQYLIPISSEKSLYALFAISGFRKIIEKKKNQNYKPDCLGTFTTFWASSEC